jgi:hypothetical protein
MRKKYFFPSGMFFKEVEHMKNNFTKEERVAAVAVDLYDFLLKNHAEKFTLEGGSLRPMDNHSISIKKGWRGYRDFSNNETGNAIDLLTRHMDYSITEAVAALAGTHGGPLEDTRRCPVNPRPARTGSCKYPEPIDGSYRHLFAYLINSRGIAPETVRKLVEDGLIYEYTVSSRDRTHYNLAFVTAEGDFGEVHGTNTYRPFHGVLPHARADGFWWYKPSAGQPSKHMYICEAAIDAISLYELHRRQGQDIHNAYISIAGCGKQNTIARFRKHPEAVLAMDNDKAGQECRIRNPDMAAIIPEHKDWNEDLLAALNR